MCWACACSAAETEALDRNPHPYFNQWTTYLTNNANVSLFWITLGRNALVLFYTTHIGAW